MNDNQEINEVRIMALNSQRKYMNNLLDGGEIDQMVFDTIVKSLDYREEALESHFRSGIAFFLRKTMRDFRRMRKIHRRAEDAGFNKLLLVRDMQIKTLKAAIMDLEEYARSQEQPEYIYAVILEYEKLITRFKRIGNRYNEKIEELKEELRLKVMDIERAEIRRMYESGEIDKEQEKELRRFINNIESILLYDYND